MTREILARVENKAWANLIISAVKSSWPKLNITTEDIIPNQACWIECDFPDSWEASSIERVRGMVIGYLMCLYDMKDED